MTTIPRSIANELVRHAPGFPHMPDRFTSDEAFEEWISSRWTKPWKKYRDHIEGVMQSAMITYAKISSPANPLTSRPLGTASESIFG